MSGPDHDRLGEDVRGDPRAPILIRIVGGQAGDPVFDPDQETAVPIPSDGGSGGNPDQDRSCAVADDPSPAKRFRDPDPLFKDRSKEEKEIKKKSIWKRAGSSNERVAAIKEILHSLINLNLNLKLIPPTPFPPPVLNE